MPNHAPDSERQNRSQNHTRYRTGKDPRADTTDETGPDGQAEQCGKFGPRERAGHTRGRGSRTAGESFGSGRRTRVFSRIHRAPHGYRVADSFHVSGEESPVTVRS